jgi:hypothetical protein
MFFDRRDASSLPATDPSSLVNKPTASQAGDDHLRSFIKHRGGMAKVYTVFVTVDKLVHPLTLFRSDATDQRSSHRIDAALGWVALAIASAKAYPSPTKFLAETWWYGHRLLRVRKRQAGFFVEPWCHGQTCLSMWVSRG